MPPELFLYALLVLAAATDLGARRIPNLIPLTGLGIALVLQLSAPQGAFLSWFGGTLVGLFLFLPFYALRGMAAGDVKLMAAVGAFVGPALALRIGVLTFLLGGLMGIVIVLATGRFKDCLANLQLLLGRWLGRARGAGPAPDFVSVGGIPYAVAIALSTLAILSWERW